jgi:hypothetical protein
MSRIAFDVHQIDTEDLWIERVVSGRRQRVNRADLKLDDCERDDRDGFVIVLMRDECRCYACDGSGNCPSCGGSYAGCLNCWGGECPDCDGSGHQTEWVQVYIDEFEWSSIRELERSQAMIQERYGTMWPESIRDWFTG